MLSKRAARSGAVGWGTALQVGRSQVRFPMVSHNHSGRNMALGSTQLLIEMSTRNIYRGKRRLVRKSDNLITNMCRLSWNLRVSKSWKPQGLYRPVMGLHSNKSLPSSFPNQILKAFLIPHVCSTQSASLIVTHSIIRTKFLNSTDYGVGHRAFPLPPPPIPPRSSSHFGPKILLRTPYGNKCYFSYLRHIMVQLMASERVAAGSIIKELLKYYN